MTDPDAQLRKRLGALLAKAVELHALQHELLREMQTVVAGGASTSDNLMRVETYFKAAWHKRYAPGETKRYSWLPGRDHLNTKRLLREMPVEEIERRIKAFFESEDPYFAKTRHTYGIFVATVNQHAAAADGHGELVLEPPPDCKHKPPCKTDQAHTAKRAKEMRG